ncbi:MAG: 3-deoxy-7-phosphoheptulonate synthase [Firmicutes bacterium]|nr:3-deoxy-7-phosphoheptulonate synthase [Bacillota bacterium]
MLVTFSSDATEAEAAGALDHLKAKGANAILVPAAGVWRIVILSGQIAPEDIGFLPGVQEVRPVLSPFKLASRETCPEDTVVNVAGVKIGGGQPVVIAGPCAVEDEEQTYKAALMVKAAGAHLLRGGAYKPRTSPYSFQGLGRRGLEILAEAGRSVGLPVVTEVVATDDLELVSIYADVLQIGARNMQNFALLAAAGKAGKPILLKRGLSATIEEWLMAAEYILKTGNRQVILCERGIRTFETLTRNTLDLSAVVAAKVYSHLPVLVDPSHATGLPELIIPLSRAATAAGADGVMVEVHPEPCEAKCDGFQALTAKELSQLIEEVRKGAECR